MLAAIIACGCASKRNTPLNRQWQAFNTRYNVYFNGEQSLRQELRRMEDSYTDDYSHELPVHPAAAHAREGAAKPQGDFTRAMAKMQKAIQQHSISRRPEGGTRGSSDREFRRREEFNPFLHNAWMRLVEAQYYAGDFSGAAATAAYVARHYRTQPEIAAEAQLWRTRAYAALGWQHEAEGAMRAACVIDPDTNARAAHYDLAAAELALLRRDHAAAVEPLRRAAKRASGTQRRRLNFLLGQVLQQLDRREEASAAYAAAGSGFSAPYESKLAARLRRSEVYTGQDAGREAEALRRLTRYARNAEYTDRIYAAIGNLYMSRSDTARAAQAYREAVAAPASDQRAHALAAIALGGLYFDRREYLRAQPLYAEALPTLGASWSDYKTMKQRSDALDAYAGYAESLRMQDSLLTLSRMSEAEQMEICRRLARETDRARRQAEQSGKALTSEGTAATVGPSPGGASGGAAAPQQFTAPGDTRWYFYNPTTVRNGLAEFRRRWGNRPLEDNWRRADKAEFRPFEQTDSVADEGASDGSGSENDEAATTDDTRPEYYMARIPRTPEAIAAAENSAAEAMLGEARTLYTQLDDTEEAVRVYNEYLRRLPAGAARAEVYYDLCMIAAAAGDDAEADRLAAEYVASAEESPQRDMLASPGFPARLRKMSADSERLYGRAFEAFSAGRAEEVDSLTDVMRRDYPMSGLMPNFVFIDALSRLSRRDTAAFRQGVEEVAARWPEAKLAPLAAAMVAGLREGREPVGSGALPDLTEARRRLATGAASTAQEAAADSVGLFTADPEAPQYLVLVFDREEVNANEVLYEVARFNFATFSVSTFDLEPITDGPVGILLVKGFANARQVERYRALLEGPDGAHLPAGVEAIGMSTEDFEHLIATGRSFDEYVRAAEEVAARRAAGLDPDNKPKQNP